MNAPINLTSEAADSYGAVCHIDRLLDDGALSVVISEQPKVLAIEGLTASTGDPQIHEALIERIRASNTPLRCRVFGPNALNRDRAELCYLAWRDKSGDVWLPLADLLGAAVKTSDGASRK